MGLYKGGDPRPVRMPVILIHGEIGTGKTSLFYTSDKPILIDTDEGSHRAYNPNDIATFLVEKGWNEFTDFIKSGGLDPYSTVGIDTAKTLLDNFLADQIMSDDPSLQSKNKGGGLSLSGYGVLANRFNHDILPITKSKTLVIICHSKDEKKGDINVAYPDVTGKTYGLLTQVADQIGFLTVAPNGKTVLRFKKNIEYVSKDIGIGDLELPDKTSSKYKDFFQREVINKVYEYINRNAKAVQSDTGILDQAKAEIAAMTTAEALTVEIASAKGKYPGPVLPFVKDAVVTRAKELGLYWGKTEAKFIPKEPENAKS